jgi:replicative DNA helicase
VVAHNEYRLLRKATQEGVFKPLIDRGITADWFTQPNMAVVAKFAFDWYAQYGKPPSPQIIVSNYPEFTYATTRDSVEALADQMVLARRRAITHSTLAAAADLTESNDTEAAVNRIREGMTELDRTTTTPTHEVDLTKSTSERYAEYTQRADGPSGILGLPTGFVTIDQATMGFQPGQLVILIASSKVGKSLVSMQCSINVHNHPTKPSVLFQSFEMSNYEQQTRHDAMRAHISHSRLRTGTLSDDEVFAYQDMLEEMEAMENPLILSDAANGITLSALAAKIEDLGRPDLIVVDGIYLMIDEITGETRTPQSLGNITTGLKRLAQRIERPILCTTQALSWKMNKNRLSADSAGYSSAISQDADVVMGLERDEEGDENSRILRVLISRNSGPVETTLNWDFEHGRFEEAVDD